MTKITRSLRMATVIALTLNRDNELVAKNCTVPYTNRKAVQKEAKEYIASVYPELEFVKLSNIERIFDCKVELPATLFFAAGTIIENEEVNALEA